MSYEDARIFQMAHGRGLPGGFKFIIPSAAISSEDVTIVRDTVAHEYVLTYEDAGRTWTGRHEDLIRAYLDLIANRLGLTSENSAPVPAGNKVEHASPMFGDEMHVWAEETPDQLDGRITRHRRMGGKVFRRTIVVIEDWTEVTDRG